MNDFNTYYSKAAALCSRAEKCSSDIFQKIIGWGADENLANEVLQKLKEEKFIDDTRYASFFVKDKFRFNKWGKIKIAYMLKQKGISGTIISEALSEIDEEEYLSVLKKLLTEKSAKTKAVNQYDKKAKLVRFAASKGFESDLIMSMIESIVS